MNFPHILQPPAEQPGRTAPARTVVVYDSLASGVRGKGFCDQLVAHPDLRAARRESLWHRDLLGAPGIGRAAARAALRAEFVVLALRGDEDISAGFEGWFRRWMPRARGRAITLIALFDQAAARPLPMAHMRSSLGKAAGAAGLHFFACMAGPDGRPAAARRQDDDAQTVEARGAPLRWGPEW